MREIYIEKAGAEKLQIIHDIAYATWPDAYGEILSAAQLEYMLRKFYAIEVLEENLREKRHHFAIASGNRSALGFVSYEHNYLGKPVTHIHKIYMLPASQGKGVGKMLLSHVEMAAEVAGSSRLSLNVNRFNKAQHFYLKHGFEIEGEENIDIGRGYLMEDYKMEKRL